MLAEIDTAAVAPEQRVDFWCTNVASIFNLERRIEQSPGGIFGAKLKACELDRLQFAETTGTPHKSTASARPESDIFSAILPLEGTVVVRQDGREARLEAGGFTLCNLARFHTIEFLTCFRHVTLNISGKELRDIFPACNYITATAISLKKGAGALLSDMVRALCERIAEIEQRQPAAIAAADAILNLLRGTLYELPQLQDTAPSRLEFYHKERIRSFVKANLRTNLSVESVAKAVDLSPRYVHSLFSKEPLSLMKWVWMERLDRCRHDLGLASLNAKSISEVAYAWGFNDPAHFSRTFRSRFGMSPSRYREQALRSPPQSPPPNQDLQSLAA